VSYFQPNHVPVLHKTRDVRIRADEVIVILNQQQFEPEPAFAGPWAMQMYAISRENPSQLIHTLTGAIHGCGGWVLSRGANESGTISMLFEFERRICVDIYALLIAAGLELSRAGHIHFTELCQCTRNNLANCGTELASVDLEIRTFPSEMNAGSDGSHGR
jgi:hypothetical protein